MWTIVIQYRSGQPQDELKMPAQSAHTLFEILANSGSDTILKVVKQNSHGVGVNWVYV